MDCAAAVGDICAQGRSRDHIPVHGRSSSQSFQELLFLCEILFQRPQDADTQSAVLIVLSSDLGYYRKRDYFHQIRSGRLSLTAQTSSYRWTSEG